MTYPITIAFRRDHLARAVRALPAEELRVFFAISTLATDTGRAWFHATRVAEDLHLDVAQVLQALRKIAEADLLERLPPSSDTIEAIELGPVFIRANAPPTNLPVEPV